MATHTFKPDQPAPLMSVGVLAWLRNNLFSSWFNTLLTLTAAYLVWLIIPPILSWAFIDADWNGNSTTLPGNARRRQNPCLPDGGLPSRSRSHWRLGMSQHVGWLASQFQKHFG